MVVIVNLHCDSGSQYLSICYVIFLPQKNDFVQVVRLEMRHFLYIFCSCTNFTLVQIDGQFPPESVINKSRVLRNDSPVTF